LCASTSSANVFLRERYFLRMGFNPLVIEACLRPIESGELLGIQVLGFNPLVIEACLRPPINSSVGVLFPFVSILSSSRHVFGRTLRASAGQMGRWFQSSRHRGMSSAMIRNKSYSNVKFGFQSSRHRGMSSARVFGDHGVSQAPSFNPLVIEACLRPGSVPTADESIALVSILSSSRHVFGHSFGRKG